MEIRTECPALYKTVSTRHICPYHQRFPGENYAGCTCGGSHGRVRKSEEELTNEDKKAIALWNKIEYSWMNAPIKITKNGMPI